MHDCIIFLVSLQLIFSLGQYFKVFQTNLCVLTLEILTHLLSVTNTCPRQNLLSWMAWPLKLLVDPALRGSLAWPVLS